MCRYMTGSYCTAVEALEIQLCRGSATSVVSILTWLRKIMFSLTALESVLYSALNAKYSRDKKYIWHSKVLEDCP